MATPAPIPKKELKRSLVAIAIIAAALSLSFLVFLTHYWFVWPAILIIILVTIGYFAASKHSYQCPSCSQEFKITAIQDFFAPHGISKDPNGELYEWKLLKCPNCKKRQKCYRVKNA